METGQLGQVELEDRACNILLCSPMEEGSLSGIFHTGQQDSYIPWSRLQK